MTEKYLQGRYTVKNPSKYVGDISKVFHRSSWELRMFIRCDTDPNILKWSSEEVVIPYISPVDGKQHRYFVDLAMLVKDKDGKQKRILAEIKPYKEQKPPKMSNRRNQKTLMKEQATYDINMAKWEAARVWVKTHGFDEFIVINEYDLGIKQRGKK